MQESRKLFKNLLEVPEYFRVHSTKHLMQFMSMPVVLKSTLFLAESVDGSFGFGWQTGEFFESYAVAELHTLCALQKEASAGKNFSVAVATVEPHKNAKYVQLCQDGSSQSWNNIPPLRNDNSVILPIGKYLLGTWSIHDQFQTLYPLCEQTTDVVLLEPIKRFSTLDVVTRVIDYDHQVIQLRSEEPLLYEELSFKIEKGW